MKNTKIYSFEKLNSSGNKMVCIRITKDLQTACKKAKINTSKVAREALVIAALNGLPQ